jgi:hypothetical protein
MNKLAGRRSLWCVFVLASLWMPAASAALPASPRRFVDNLDERCYLIQGQPALGLTLNLTFLDPVLVKQGLKAGSVVLQEPQKLCVPVKKNGIAPPPDTLPFVQFLDWKCYGIKGEPLKLSLELTQLNQTIAKVLGPTVKVAVGEAQQLCVPVVKNNVVAPPAVKSFVQFLDVECFGVTSNQQIAGKPITLAHLNPMFAGRTPENLKFPTPGPNQLCTPVAKENQMPPSGILPFIRYSDVLCYPMGGINLDSLLTLTQLDPVMIAKKVAPEKVSVGLARSFCVPVAKNGDLPPGAP